MTTARRIVPLLAFLVALALPASASALKLTYFQSPSHRIGCIIVDNKDLRCDGPDRRSPPRPKSCDVDYGGAFGMRGTGRASRLCVGDTAHDRRAPVLRYGHTLRRGPFTCTSRRTGMTCHNRSNHGWHISLQHTYLF